MADHPDNPHDRGRSHVATDRWDHVPDYVLEQYALRELPALEMDALDRRLEADEALRARLARLQTSNEEILARHPADQFAAAVEQRLAAEQRGATARARPAPDRPARGPIPRPWMALTPALAVAAIVIFLIVRPGPPSAPPAGSTGSATEVTRAKGSGAHLCVFRNVGDAVDTLADRQIAQQGDVLQLSYVPMGRRHGAILSIDGRGTTTLHFPASPQQSTRLREAGETMLPHAYELDDAPDFERFFLITAAGPLDVQAILAAARQLARSPERACMEPLALPDTLEQTSFVVRKKESRP